MIKRIIIIICAIVAILLCVRYEQKEIAYREKMENVFKYCGEYVLTAYCPCVVCCDYSADGITATGTTATAQRTIAVDPKIIKYGSKIIIDETEYIAEDCGGAIKGNRFDVYFDTHSEALVFGRKKADIYLDISTGIFYGMTF